MGMLRTLLAISVVTTHSYGYFFVGGQNAVQLFYMISGFLISYVLLEQKSYSSVRKFYISRAIRLYPVYLMVAALTLVALFFSDLYIKRPELFVVWSEAPIAAKLLLAFSNLFLIGQDWIMFLGVEEHRLVFMVDFFKSHLLLFRGLLVPQAWTLGVELTFYLTAPFILYSRLRIWLLLLGSLGLRYWLVLAGIGSDDPWTYRFFPTELALFLMGALSHQLLLPVYLCKLKNRLKKSSQLATIFLIVICMIYFKIPVPELYRTVVLFSIFLLLLPLLFVFSNYYKIDRTIGELSYPVYICHILILMITMAGMEYFKWSSKAIGSVLCVAFSLAFAWILNWFIGRRAEIYRARFRESHRINISEKYHNEPKAT